PLLAERGLEIFGADSSPRMVTLAEANWRDWQDAHPESGARAPVEGREGANTGFHDGKFDAILCKRLFHHFPQTQVRVAVLREFHRIWRGRILLSFFNSFALDAIRFRLKHWLRGTTPTDRIPIPMDEIVHDATEAGLKVLGSSAVVWGISPMWYLELG